MPARVVATSRLRQRVAAAGLVALLAAACSGSSEPDAAEAPTTTSTAAATTTTTVAPTTTSTTTTVAPQDDLGSLTFDEAERRNFMVLATRDCLAAQGAASGSLVADDAGNLLEGLDGPGGDVESSLLDECRERQYRELTASCVTADDPASSWEMRYRATLIDDQWLMSGFTTVDAPGTWRFSDWSDNTNTFLEPDDTGAFELELSTSRALARTPDGTCALVLDASGAEGFRRVAVVGDSNTAALAIDLAAPNDFAPDIRAWTVAGESGGTWFAADDIASSGPLDELQGALATDPAVVVLALGINDALVWGVGSDTPAGDAVEVATTDAVGDVLARVAGIDCVIVVTPPAEPTTALDAGESYAEAARRLNAMLAAATASAPNAHLADWASVSAPHHGTAEPWFVPDEIHLTELGRVEFAHFLAGTIGERCDPAAAATVSE